MGLRSVILEKSKVKSQTSSGLPTSYAHNLVHGDHRYNSTSTSCESTPRRSQAEAPAADSYEAFIQKAERDEQERLELLELESRIRKRTESWNDGKRSKDGGTRAWLIGNGLSK